MPLCTSLYHCFTHCNNEFYHYEIPSSQHRRTTFLQQTSVMGEGQLTFVGSVPSGSLQHISPLLKTSLLFKCFIHLTMVQSQSQQSAMLFPIHITLDMNDRWLDTYLSLLPVTGNTPGSHNFRAHIRQYNSALAMASWNANIRLQAGRGPPVISIHGQAYHITGDALPQTGQRPTYAQLYILDTQQALHERTSNPLNAHLLPDVIQLLRGELQRTNPFVHQFRNMANVMQRQEELAVRNNHDIPQVRMIISHRHGQGRRRYNDPTAAEIAVVYEGDEGAPPHPSSRDITIFPRTTRGTHTINALNPNVDPLTYPLLFPAGEFGYSIDMRQVTDDGETNPSKRVTMRQFYAFRIAVREGFSLLHNAGLQLHQYLVDAYAKIEGNMLTYIRLNQRQLRVELYRGLLDHLNTRANELNVAVGRVVILPSSFVGSPRNMYQHFLDAMTIVRVYGKPDYFITFTANPNWPEILHNIEPHQTPNDRPDITTRVFHIKLQQFKHDLLTVGLLGMPIAHVYTIEFQKRGLPHAHLLLFVRDIDKPRTPEIIDAYVSAEIPDPDAEPELYAKVKRHMIHGPCGRLNRNSPCMENGICKKSFPKHCCDETILNDDGYPSYKRRRRFHAHVRGKTVSDEFVVPYSPVLLTKYNCHINVEVCTTVKSVKYIFKYIHKGFDCAAVEVRSGKPCHLNTTLLAYTDYVA